jgi:hypothetical protein
MLVGRDDLGLGAGVDGDQAVEDVQRIARGAGHDHLPDPHHLVVYALRRVMARLYPKYCGDGPALTVCTGTTNRSPSTRGQQPAAPLGHDRDG